MWGSYTSPGDMCDLACRVACHIPDWLGDAIYTSLDHICDPACRRPNWTADYALRKLAPSGRSAADVGPGRVRLVYRVGPGHGTGWDVGWPDEGFWEFFLGVLMGLSGAVRAWAGRGLFNVECRPVRAAFTCTSRGREGAAGC